MTTASEANLPLVVGGDLFQVATFVAAEFAARALPEHLWPAFSRRFAALSLAGRRRRARADAQKLAPFLGALMDDDPSGKAAVKAVLATAFEGNVFLHAARRNPKWRPPIQLEGSDALRDALALEGGAVLWVVPVTFATLVVKMALADAGYDVTHLSQERHGGGHSKLSIWLNNRWQTAVEERFVTRAVIPRNTAPTVAIRQLQRALASNAVVTVAGVDQAEQPLELPFLGGWLRLGLGAPRLALRRAAPLFAVITTRKNGVFHVRLRPLALPVEAPPGPDDREDKVKQLAQDFVLAYEGAIRRNPEMLRRGTSALLENVR